MTNSKQRVAIITGASEGIGRALALVLAARGQYPRLVLAARNAERLESLQTQCERLGAMAVAVATNVADADDCKRLIATTIDQFGRLDTVYHNAGVTMWAKFEELEDLRVVHRLMAVNYYGVVYCTHYALPHLRATGGRIVAVASVAGFTGVPERTAYAASKHAMVGFFDSLRIELADSGVSVTIVAPDFVVSEIHKRAVRGDGSTLGKSPLQVAKIMTSERCAALIAAAGERRQRLLITSWRGRLGRVLRVVWPGLIDRIAARAIERGR